MSIFRNGAWLLAATILLGNAWAQSPALTPAEAFAVLPDKDPAISPDGKRFAVIRDNNGRPAVSIYEIGTNTPPVVIKSAELLISDIKWVKDDVLLIYSRVNKKLGVWETRSEVRTLVNATAVLVKDNTQKKLWAYTSIKDINLDDPDIILARAEGLVLRINVRTGHTDYFSRDRYSDGVTGVADWFFDGHGKPVARLDFDYSTEHALLHLMVPDGSSWRRIATYPFSADTGSGLLGVASDGLSMIREAGLKTGTTAIRRVDLKDGTETILLQDPRYDDYGALANEWTGRVEGVSLVRDSAEYHYFDPKMEAIQKGVAAAFPGLSAHIASADRNLEKLIVAVEGPRTPITYYLLNRKTHQAGSIVATYPDLDERMLGEVKPYPIKARDGLDLDAYLTLPPNKAPKNLPLIVMPHGGPDLRDDLSFDWWSQFLASRGYAVLRPNFRGSSGYGRTFTDAGARQWGLKMQDDISDSVKKAIADGIADPKRVCIVGASYGGYAALAGATLTPSLYACVVSYAGIGNLENILGYAKQDTSSYYFWQTRLGNPQTDSDRLRATSPALHAANATAPILLIHSELDNTVPIAQSITMEKALRDAGKNVEFIRVPGDDHYLGLASTRVTVLKAIERFLKTNIGN